MGTRADFYIGRGEDAEWLGSIAWDGYPEGLTPRVEEQERMWPGGPMTHKHGSWGAGVGLLDSTTEEQFRERLARFFQYRDDVTLPEHGWPWPWETSHTTDFAYALDDGVVWASCFGYPWQRAADFDGDTERDDKMPAPAFPDMSARKNVQFGGKRSGIMVISGSGER
jgi:hypothetical protein